MNDPRNEPDNSHLFECENCHNILNKYEGEDPIRIDKKVFCDKCASDLTVLRWGEVVEPVNKKTKRLVKDAEDEAYHKIWQQHFDSDGKVKHI